MCVLTKNPSSYEFFAKKTSEDEDIQFFDFDDPGGGEFNDVAIKNPFLKSRRQAAFREQVSFFFY